jgi:hypothetical protein
MVSMLRFRTFRALLLLAPLAAGCGDNNSNNTPTGPGPVQVSQTFTSEDDPSPAATVTGPLNPNGGRTHAFTVQQAGTVTATLTGLGPDETITVGLSLGTWNGQVCQVILRNDAAKVTNTITGAAQQTGNFCVSIYDVGQLTGPTTYSIVVTHF